MRRFICHKAGVLIFKMKVKNSFDDQLSELVGSIKIPEDKMFEPSQGYPYENLVAIPPTVVAVYSPLPVSPFFVKILLTSLLLISLTRRFDIIYYYLFLVILLSCSALFSLIVIK